MIVAASMGGFRHYPLEEALSILEEIGFDHFEGTTDGRAHFYPFAVEGEDPTPLEALLARHRLTLVAVAGGWSDFAVADRHLEAQYASVRRQLALCQRLNVRVLRLFASHLPSKYVEETFFARVVRNLARLAPEAAAARVCLAIENHYGITATADDMLRILDGVASPFVRANLDPANFVPMGEDPVVACRRLLPYIAHVHLKDAVYTGKGRHEGYEYCEIGAGAVQYPAILAMLKESCYKGAICVEYENVADVVRGTVVSRRNLRCLLEALDVPDPATQSGARGSAVLR